MSSALYLVGGLAILLAALLPSALSRLAVSPPMVLLAAGICIGFVPVGGHAFVDPVGEPTTIEQVTQFTVLLPLMGVGLALDRPLRWLRFSDWRRWSSTWRLLLAVMPLGILGVWLLGWWGLGLTPATALLLGAVLAPTDPVLAGDVQVGGPDVETAETEESDERHEVRFALTSEAGLNDGLAFPFVTAAILLLQEGPTASWIPHWLAWELLGRVLLGACVGGAVGWVLAKLAFRARRESLRLAEQGEPLLALAALAASRADARGGPAAGTTHDVAGAALPRHRDESRPAPRTRLAWRHGRARSGSGGRSLRGHRQPRTVPTLRTRLPSVGAARLSVTARRRTGSLPGLCSSALLERRHLICAAEHDRRERCIPSR